MRWSLVVGVVFAGALAVGAVLLAPRGSDEDFARFGPILASVQELVGTELTANGVVAMPCIPSRSDPVGVWLAIRVVGADIADDAFTLQLQETDARLGSHPSGCSKPEILLVQSVFVLDGDEPIFAAQQSVSADGIRLVFGLDGRSLADLDVVVLPTIEFEMADGMRQTAIFGLMGRYSLT